MTLFDIGASLAIREKLAALPADHFPGNQSLGFGAGALMTSPTHQKYNSRPGWRPLPISGNKTAALSPTTLGALLGGLAGGGTGYVLGGPEHRLGGALTGFGIGAAGGAGIQGLRHMGIKQIPAEVPKVFDVKNLDELAGLAAPKVPAVAPSPVSSSEAINEAAKNVEFIAKRTYHRPTSLKGVPAPRPGEISRAQDIVAKMRAAGKRDAEIARWIRLRRDALFPSTPKARPQDLAAFSFPETP